MNNYRGWKILYLPFSKKYMAVKSNFNLTAENRVAIEREIDKFEDKIQSVTQ